MIEVPLANGRGVALIDDDDEVLVAGLNWCLATRGYAQGTVGRMTPVLMHRLILGAPAGIGVDHRDRDKLNNRRANLRLATNRQNQGNVGRAADNTSGFRGVSWHTSTSRWRAYIADHGRNREIGCFDTAEAAARAYDRAALVVFGEFASLNFPGGPR